VTADKLTIARGCLWEIASAILGIALGVALMAAILAAAAYFLGLIPSARSENATRGRVSSLMYR
jgi:hypothetical protein